MSQKGYYSQCIRLHNNGSLREPFIVGRIPQSKRYGENAHSYDVKNQISSCIYICTASVNNDRFFQFFCDSSTWNYKF